MKKTTIAELAEKANVSVTTVSRVFNGHPYIKAETADLVKKIARDINYIPKSAAHVRRVALIIHEFRENIINNYSASLMMMFGDYCAKNGISFQIITSNCLDLLDEYYIDYSISTTPKLKNISKYRNTKFVFINTIPPGQSGVRSENYETIRHAVRYLVERGCKRPAIVLPLAPSINIFERKDAFNRAARELKIPQSDFAVIELDYRRNEFEDFSKAIRRIDADGLIIGGEAMPMKICYFLGLLNIRVPADMSVISYEAPGFSEFLMPPHTTISQDFGKLVSEAFKMLDKFPGAGDGEEEVMVPCGFIERDSVIIRNS